jgi:hypothetical protein
MANPQVRNDAIRNTDAAEGVKGVIPPEVIDGISE